MERSKRYKSRGSLGIFQCYIEMILFAVYKDLEIAAQGVILGVYYALSLCFTHRLCFINRYVLSRRNVSPEI